MNVLPHILLVDDESKVRETTALILSSRYHVSIAEDGFAALLQMKKRLPDVLISDLNMPHMSGFELLSVVRRRFPQVLVVAMSGAYERGEEVPGGVIADAFYPKGQHDPDALLAAIDGLLKASASRARAHSRQPAPVWIPRNGKDPDGRPFVVLTCPECLRSFPLTVEDDVTGEVWVTPCVFCMSDVRYIIDFSLYVASPVVLPMKRPARAANG